MAINEWAAAIQKLSLPLPYTPTFMNPQFRLRFYHYSVARSVMRQIKIVM